MESLSRAHDDLDTTFQALKKSNEALKNAFEEIRALRDQLYKENLG